MLLLCSFLRLKELFQVKNGLTKLLLFFCLKIAKIWVGRTTLNEEKKEDGPRLAKQQICTCITLFHCHHCMTTMWNYFMFHEWCNTRIFFFSCIRLKALCDSAQLICNIKFMEFFSSMQGDRYLHRKQKKGKGLHRSPTNLSPWSFPWISLENVSKCCP